MLRTFSEAELVEMCKKRGPGYREDILALSAVRPDGKYELDTGSEAYFKLKNKYVAAKLPPMFSPEARASTEAKIKKAAALVEQKERQKTLQLEAIYVKGRELVTLLGEGSPFAFAFAEFLDRERRGGCRSCGRSGELRKLLAALKLSMYAAPLERRQQVPPMFPDTVFFELMPNPLKWDDFMK